MPLVNIYSLYRLQILSKDLNQIALVFRKQICQEPLKCWWGTPASHLQFYGFVFDPFLFFKCEERTKAVIHYSVL